MSRLTGDILMTMGELSTYLRYDHDTPGKRNRGAESALKWAKRESVPLERRGRCWLVRKSFVDLKLRGAGVNDSRLTRHDSDQTHALDRREAL